MSASGDPDAAVVLVETFRQLWAAGDGRLGLGPHRRTARGVSFRVAHLVPTADGPEPEVELAWSEIVGAVINDDRLLDLKARVARLVSRRQDPSPRLSERRMRSPLPRPTHRPHPRPQ